MQSIFAILFLVFILYLFVQFARQECIQDDYLEVVDDVESRYEWARTRTLFPFGMRAQLERSQELLWLAKSLWQKGRWQQAHCVVRQSQDAMNKAQRIYCSVVCRQG